jgi:hypothetical protein
MIDDGVVGEVYGIGFGEYFLGFVGDDTDEDLEEIVERVQSFVWFVS